RTTLVANNHDESVGAIQTIGVGQDQNIFIGGNQQKMIKGSRGMMINGPRYTEINAVSSSEMEGAKGDAAALLPPCWRWRRKRLSLPKIRQPTR
ncbi:hypothetical protein OM190_24555, partial [Escherichia albertii]|nr:hypothetical protein [Escherichia albertii]MCZ8989245.1 hypothetical protein [Escherichia albertii]MCZ8998538.1 hypothetical protein [Escherichia albertii]MCZ9008623.1 hypothetical protein [Escherichia albertii]MCZ9027243.1 hypothetical protein [Escherichia albertii]